MFGEPRNWKWMVPAALVGPCLWWWNDWSMSGDPWQELAIIPAVLMVILIISALVNLLLYGYHHWAQEYSGVQSVRNSTPEVRMFEAAKGMHPEAVKALLVHRRSIWRVKYVPLKDTVDWIFDELPTVHAGFVDFVLDHSTAISVMSKRLLSEGAKQFDPEEIMTDYQQYDDLINYLQVKLMCTQAYGNQAPQWLPPWNPDLVRHRLGLDGAPYAVEEEGITEAMKSVIRAQSKWQSNGNGKLQDLSQVETTSAKKKAEEAKPAGTDTEITDKEFEAAQQIQTEFDAQTPEDWQRLLKQKIKEEKERK